MRAANRGVLIDDTVEADVGHILGIGFFGAMEFPFATPQPQQQQTTSQDCRAQNLDMYVRTAATTEKVRSTIPEIQLFRYGSHEPLSVRYQT